MYSLSVVHDNVVVVGGAQDEWGGCFNICCAVIQKSDINKYNIKTIKNGGYIIGVDLNLITPKKDITIKINTLKTIKKKWFSTFDKYGEIEDRIHEIAYGFVKD